MMRGFFRRIEQAAEKAAQEADEKRAATRQHQPSSEAVARREAREAASQSSSRSTMPDERDVSKEVDYLSGVIFAHETLLSAIMQGLAVSGIVTRDNQHQLITDLLNAGVNHSEFPEFGVGYREALEKFRRSL